MTDKKPKSPKKKIIYTALGVLVVVGLLSNLMESRETEKMASEGGFESVREFEAAKANNIFTKAEYDVFIAERDRADKAAAVDGGFLSVDEYKKAQYVNMPTKVLYDRYLEQQAELKLAEEKRKAEEAETARLAKAAEEKRKAEEAEKARLAEAAEEKRKAEEAEAARLAEAAEEKRKAEEAEAARLAEAAEEKRQTEIPIRMFGLKMPEEQKLFSSSKSCNDYVNKSVVSNFGEFNQGLYISEFNFTEFSGESRIYSKEKCLNNSSFIDVGLCINSVNSFDSVSRTKNQIKARLGVLEYTFDDVVVSSPKLIEVKVTCTQPENSICKLSGLKFTETIGVCES